MNTMEREDGFCLSTFIFSIKYEAVLLAERGWYQQDFNGKKILYSYFRK